MSKIPFRSLALAIAFAALLAAIAALRARPGALLGDEPTYAAMIASLARDGDLRFEATDRAWVEAREDPGLVLILQRTPEGIAYSKPILYPLLVAPLYRGLGPAAFLVFNLAVVGAALALAAAALRRRSEGARAVPTVLCFAFASTAVAYCGWIMSEPLQLALAAAGLALALARELGSGEASSRVARALDAPAAPWAGMVLLGLLVALREPNAAVAAVPVVVQLGARRWRRAAALAGAAVAAYAVVVALTLATTGAPNPYRAVRSAFTPAGGLPDAGDPATLVRFERSESLATTSLGLVPRWRPAQTAYATLYFFVGRHTGLLVYFPAALALLWAAARARDRVGGAALAGFSALAAFYLVYWPSNYFGGEACLGNRYLLAAYPCLLFAPAALPGARARAVAWALAAAVGVSALVSVRATRALDPLSQNHAYAGLFRWLPYESIASDIDGRRDRYWAGDFVRFVDPFARVGESSFELVAGAPAAELEVATDWDGSPLRLLIVSDAPDATLVVSDWLRRREVRLGRHGRGAGGAVEWRPSPAWRVHRFWWSGTADYRTRLVRLRLASATPGAVARVRYLGRRGVPTAGFEREVERVELPLGGAAGGRAEIPVRVVHRGGWTWSSSATLPVRLAASLVALEGVGVAEFRADLPRPIRPSERLDAAIAVDWPERPGRYRLTVDLVLEDVAWFGDKLGEPLAAAEVTVSPRPAASAAAGSPAPIRP